MTAKRELTDEEMADQSGRQTNDKHEGVGGGQIADAEGGRKRGHESWSVGR